MASMPMHHMTEKFVRIAYGDYGELGVIEACQWEVQGQPVG